MLVYVQPKRTNEIQRNIPPQLAVTYYMVEFMRTGCEV